CLGLAGLSRSSWRPRSSRRCGRRGSWSRRTIRFSSSRRSSSRPASSAGSCCSRCTRCSRSGTALRLSGRWSGNPRPWSRADVPDGGKQHFEIMGYDILVVRLGDRFFCVDAACTYKWAMLTDGLVDREKLLITCKDCNGSWDLQTGQPKELPAKFPLTAYRIESVADDLIVTFTY